MKSYVYWILDVTKAIPVTKIIVNIFPLKYLFWNIATRIKNSSKLPKYIIELVSNTSTLNAARPKIRKLAIITALNNTCKFLYIFTSDLITIL